jgi:hypothetical protein
MNNAYPAHALTRAHARQRYIPITITSMSMKDLS